MIFLARSAPVLLALAALALALSPLLATPLVSDDVINRSFGWLSAGAFAQATLDEVRHWALSAGRIFFLSTWLKNATFQVFEGVLVYKLWLLALNLGAAAVFAAYVRALTESWRAAAAALLALAVLFQLRDYHDPIVSFNGLFQLCAALTFAALTLHLRYLQGAGTRWLVAALALFVLNLFAYEMAMLTVVLAWLQRRVMAPGAPRGGVRWFVAAFAAYAFVVLATRAAGASAGMAGSVYGLGLDPGRVAVTFAKQLLAALPFTHAFFRPVDGNWTVAASPERVAWLGAWQFFLAAPVFAALAWLALRTAARRDAQAPTGTAALASSRALLVLAAALLVLPALMVSVVSRYQGAFAPGNGYSPVYLQVFGLALAAGVVAQALAARRGLAAAVAVVVGTAAAGNLANNAAVAAALARAWSPQQAWEGALRLPDVAAACAGTLLVLDPGPPWNESRVVANAGLKYVDRPQAAGFAGPACAVATVTLLGRPAVALARVDAGKPTGRVLVALPLAEGEERNALSLADCPAATRMPLVAAGRFSGTRVGLFAAEEAGGMLAWEGQRLALQCASKGK